MSIDRRKFLSLIGSAAFVGLAGKGLYEVIAGEDIQKIVTSSEGVNIQKNSSIRWVMVIDIKKFSEGDNFAKCIEACHKAHNVPYIKNKRHEIKWLWDERFEHAFIEQNNNNLPGEILNSSVLLLCNHCNKPPCTNVCPTKATWRRDDGIVMMDWHRCIGCRYCIAACPYSSRSFNYIEPKPLLKKINDNFPARTRGVVEKCTFCSEYIIDGKYSKPPECVSACSQGAMYFGNLFDRGSDVYKILSSRYSIRRKPELGTSPEVYYIIDEEV
jgi:molybdopterin-containing oxidoreductase family iron-sulfur binding subunit